MATANKDVTQHPDLQVMRYISIMTHTKQKAVSIKVYCMPI